MKPSKYIISLLAISILPFNWILSWAEQKVNSKDVLQIGKPLPDSTLKQYGGPDIRLQDIKGKLKIISIVPQLNTPVCDEQTHRFSETNGGLDKALDIITISTNSAEGQYKFAQKAKIKNLIFLSDAPGFEFGNRTGLLNESFRYLKRTVLIADEENIIRYVDLVPGGGMPNIKKALAKARIFLKEKTAN